MKRQYLHTAILLLTIWCGTATKAEAADITIDLSTVSSSGTGYTVADNLITLNGAGNTYIFARSGTEATVRGIRADVSCNIALRGVNISLRGADALYVNENCTVSLTFAGDNTLNVTTANAALFSKGSLTLAGASGNEDILRCIAPKGNGINSQGDFTFSSGTVYAEGGGNYNGIRLYSEFSGKTVAFSGGTVIAKGYNGIYATNYAISFGENATLIVYGKHAAIYTEYSNELDSHTIRWGYTSAPSSTDETVLVVKNSAKAVVRTFRLPAGYKRVACNVAAGDTYTLWLRDLQAATDTQMKASDGTTAFTRGSEYEGLATTATVEPITTQPTATYNTATETGKTLDFFTLDATTAKGVLKDATAVTLTGTWTSSDIDKLTSALVPAAGNNTTLLTADLGAMTFSGESLSMENLFRDFKALTSVTMPTATYAGSVDLTNAFYNCSSLETADLSAFTNMSSFQSTFNNCAKLASVKLGVISNDIYMTFYNANPNCLKYLPAGTATAPEGWDNCIADGKALGNIVLTDGKPFHCPEAFEMGEGNTMSYDRTLTQNKWATFCLPFATAVPADCVAKQLTSSTSETVAFAEVQTLEANKPYIVAYTGSDASSLVTFTSAAAAAIPATPETLETEPANASYKMAGTYTDITERFMYLLDDNSFLLYNAGNLHPFRAYITATGGQPNLAPRLAIGNEGGATGIGCIPAPEAEAIPAVSYVYTVDGRLVKTVPVEEYSTLKDGLERGVYIVNGTKVAVTE